MEQKLIIAEILKHKPQGIKLYSPIFGDCTFCYVKDESSDICVRRPYNEVNYFNFDGVYHTGGECLLFPSKEMRDWEKFSWKRGDVLISDCGFVCIFKEWASDDYTRFNGCYFDGMPNARTAKYSKLDNDTAYGYIRELENRCGGKLNLETLKIEKQLEFKDGDILSCDEDSFTKHTTLILHKDENITESIVSLIRHKKLVETNVPIDNFLLSRLYPAREDEKKELFDALAKGGKAWDAEKKIIVNLKHKCEFKPFDKVLGRNEKDDVWEADLFSHYRKESQYPFRCIGCSRKYCIPYEGNEHLLGIRNNPE